MPHLLQSPNVGGKLVTGQIRGDVSIKICILQVVIFFTDWTLKFYAARFKIAFSVAKFFSADTGQLIDANNFYKSSW